MKGQANSPPLPAPRSAPLKVLLVIEQCNPEWPSVPSLGFHFFDQVSKRADATLVTHIRNREALERVIGGRHVVYIEESRAMQRYFWLVVRLSSRGGTNWPLRHALGYPAYAAFDRQVRHRFRGHVEAGAFDIVHAFTPIIPRYPYAIAAACQHTPFVLGPVNGGLPYPRGFGGIARKEFGGFNVLRRLVRWIPGYVRTYQHADRVLAGSGSTLGQLRRGLGLRDDRLALFHENGISSEFFASSAGEVAQNAANLLFVGRLVPYKCADVVIEAVHRLAGKTRRPIRLTIVGDGPERASLEALTASLGLSERVTFAGWVKQRDTIHFYRQADIFCFPSIREFGGAVVLEAMASGLPSIVADYGGVAEYVTDGTGFKLPLTSRERLVADLAAAVRRLVEDEPLRLAMASAAVHRARQFEWPRKGTELLSLYRQVIEEKRARECGH